MSGLPIESVGQAHNRAPVGPLAGWLAAGLDVAVGVFEAGRPGPDRPHQFGGELLQPRDVTGSQRLGGRASRGSAVASPTSFGADSAKTLDLTAYLDGEGASARGEEGELEA
jgi:hypothetical protein